MNKTDIAQLRTEYTLRGLVKRDLNPDPIKQFSKWFEEALKADLMDVNAMSLATATLDGKPAVRMVLLKGFDKQGFVFFTNYKSSKGRQLELNPNAAVVFYWAEVERQICITGRVEKTSRAESDAYFKSRPIGSQLGALASDQSQIIPSRDVLEAKLDDLQKKYANEQIPLPDYWGGYRLSPETIEFWQGRPNRLHDRLRYTRLSEGGWKIDRLSP